MAEKYLVTLDRAHLRFYRFSQQPGQFTPSIQPVDAFDLPSSDGLNEADPTGRYAGAKSWPNSHPADEVPPLPDRGQTQAAELLAERITSFLEKRPNSTWKLAAGSALRDVVIAALPEAVRLRLDQVISKDLVNVPPVELREHFALR